MLLAEHCVRDMTIKFSTIHVHFQTWWGAIEERRDLTSIQAHMTIGQQTCHKEIPAYRLQEYFVVGSKTDKCEQSGYLSKVPLNSCAHVCHCDVELLLFMRFVTLERNSEPGSWGVPSITVHGQLLSLNTCDSLQLCFYVAISQHRQIMLLSDEWAKAMTHKSIWTSDMLILQSMPALVA